MAKEVIVKAEQIKKRRKIDKASALLLLLIFTFNFPIINFFGDIIFTGLLNKLPFIIFIFSLKLEFIF